MVLELQCTAMTLEHYILLGNDDQYTVWLTTSVQVASYEEAGVINILYQVDAFYIQMSYFRSYPMQVWFKAFCELALLEPYLSRIDLPDICH